MEKTISIRESQLNRWVSKLHGNSEICHPFKKDSVKSRKSRTRMMMEALRSGCTVKGNVGVNYSSDCFIFSYRGTEILKWNTNILEDDAVSLIDAGIYEETPSTMNQRKMARQAIDEFRRIK